MHECPSRGTFTFLLGLLLPGLLLLAWSGGPALAADRPILLFPPDLTLSPEAKITVFVFRRENGPAIRLFVNGKQGAPLAGTSFFQGEASLRPGRNVIKAGPKEVRVYYLEGPRRESFTAKAGKGKAPLIFRSYRLHPALEEGCDGCHRLKEGKLEVKEQKEACYACHDDFGKTAGGEQRHLHEPVANGECTSCHDPHYSTLPKLQKDPKGCLACHELFPSRGSVHRPVRRGRCTDCHDPHAGVAPKQLVRAGNALCTGCHDDFHAHHRGEAVPGPMTVLSPDVPRDGRTLSCLACHAPHQSLGERLLLAAGKELCRRCHPG